MIDIFKREMNDGEKKVIEWMEKIPELVRSGETVKHDEFGSVPRWNLISVDDVVCIFDEKRKVYFYFWKSGEVSWRSREHGHTNIVRLFHFWPTKGLKKYRSCFFNMLKIAETREKSDASTRRKLLLKYLFEQ